MLLFLDSVPYIIIFIFGIVIGSFLNVCIYRLPLHESIIMAPSHCMTCGRKLRWYDMVPVFSWIVLGGKCRNCKSKISVQYPIIEALNGILYVLVCAVNGLTWVSLLYCLMVSARSGTELQKYFRSDLVVYVKEAAPELKIRKK